MAGTVTHFEIFAEDPASLAQFYRQLFGWQIDKARAVDYYHIQTGQAEAKDICGGLLYRPIPGPRSWVHYVSVESIDKIVELIESLGGKILRGKTAVPKTAWYAVVEDPQGNIFAVWQADAKAFPPLEPEA